MKGLLDIIEEYDVKLPLEQLIQISNLILPRLYTIASSSKKHPKVVKLCVSLEMDKLPDGKIKMGLNSGFFQRKQRSGAFGQVRIRAQDSTFALPTDNKVPVSLYHYFAENLCDF